MAREKLAYDDDAAIAEELENQTDRGLAIVGASYVDAKLGEVLQHLLSVHLEKEDAKNLFDGPTAPLGSFSNRIRMAFALGVIGPKTRSDLDLIRAIRNEFAHKLKIRSFDDPPIADRCRSLQLADISLLGGTPRTRPRDRFLQSTILSLHLLYGEMRRGFEVVNRPLISP